MEPLVPDTYDFRLPSGHILHVCTRLLPTGERPQARLESPDLYFCGGPEQIPYGNMMGLADKLEALANEIRTVARRLPQ